MHRAVLEFGTCFGHEDLELERRPLENACEEADPDAFVTFEVVEQLVLADLLELPILGPRIDGNFEEVFLDIDEACFLHKVPVFGVERNSFAISSGGLANHFGVLLVVGTLLMATVVRGQADIEILDLKVATWFEVPDGQSSLSKRKNSLECLLCKHRPIRDSSDKKARMHIVETILLIEPFAFQIIDLELNVIWYPDLISISRRSSNFNILPLGLYR